LGSINGASDILAHPWFKDMDVEALLSYSVEPPFIPEKNENGDYKEYFNVKEGKKAMEDSIIPQENLRAIKKNKDLFKGFSSGSVWKEFIHDY